MKRTKRRFLDMIMLTVLLAVAINIGLFLVKIYYGLDFSPGAIAVLIAITVGVWNWR